MRSHVGMQPRERHVEAALLAPDAEGGLEPDVEVVRAPGARLVHERPAVAQETDAELPVLAAASREPLVVAADGRELARAQRGVAIDVVDERPAVPGLALAPEVVVPPRGLATAPEPGAPVRGRIGAEHDARPQGLGVC